MSMLDHSECSRRIRSFASPVCFAVVHHGHQHPHGPVYGCFMSSYIYKDVSMSDDPALFAGAAFACVLARPAPTLQVARPAHSGSWSQASWLLPHSWGQRHQGAALLCSVFGRPMTPRREAAPTSLTAN